MTTKVEKIIREIKFSNITKSNLNECNYNLYLFFQSINILKEYLYQQIKIFSFKFVNYEKSYA